MDKKCLFLPGKRKRKTKITQIFNFQIKESIFVVVVVESYLFAQWNLLTLGLG